MRLEDIIDEQPKTKAMRKAVRRGQVGDATKKLTKHKTNRTEQTVDVSDFEDLKSSGVDDQTDSLV